MAVKRPASKAKAAKRPAVKKPAQKAKPVPRAGDLRIT